MDDFAVVKTLRAAIYGRVALVRHRATDAVYAMKIMSLAHVAAQRAVGGPVVCEDGITELRVLRRISGNRVVVGTSRSGGSEETVQDVDRTSWSVHPAWEAQRASALPSDHHHLLTLHTDFVDERANARCLVFDFCPYGELYDQIQRTPNQALGLETVRAFFMQIATAVRFIHAQNIAHRDLSLENVLVDTNRQCRLGDFGLACEYGTMCSGRVGKAFYMAPEVYDWQPDELYNGLKADMWSLGIILFVLSTGAPPFEAAHEIDARFRVVKAKGIRELLSVWRLDEKLPFQLCDLVESLLRIDPDDRMDIDDVWSHPWLQGGVYQNDSAWERVLQLQHEQTDAHGKHAVDEEDHEDEETEPQEEMETENGSSQPTKRRQRKRIKISAEGCVVKSMAAAGRLAGFFRGSFVDEDVLSRVGRPPELRHEHQSGETSPEGSGRRHIQPKTSPIVWPKVGVKAALRSLFQATQSNTAGSYPDELLHEPETKVTAEADGTDNAAQNRRRPRVDSTSSCSSSSSGHHTSSPKSGELDSQPTQPPTTHRCRFCLRWVHADNCTHLVTLPTRDELTANGEPRSKTRRVCDSCYLVVSAALVCAREGTTSGDETQWLHTAKSHAPHAA